MAYSSAIASSIVQLFNYLQNLGATVNLPKFEMPEQVGKVISIFTKFLHTLLNLIPKIPAFDVRAQLVILALGIPLVLDIFFIWFVNPLQKTLSHIFDLLILVVFSMSVTQGLLQSWTKGKTVCSIMTAAYVVLRGLYFLCEIYQKDVETRDLNKYTKRICKLFMTGVIPGVKTKRSRRTLEQEIRQYVETVQYQARKPKVVTIIVLFLIFGILMVASLWSVGVIPIDINCPAVIVAFMPYIGFTFSFFLLIIIILMLTNCGRQFIMGFRHFANRWGLRLLMLFFDLLYIPIMTNLVTILTPVKFTCGDGFYLQYERRSTSTENDLLFDFVNHSWECRQCFSTLVSTRHECQVACSGEKEWRIMGALNLRLFDDILIVSGGILLFTIFAFLFGIPILWRVIIRRNRRAVKRINIYGNNFDRKWKAVVHRLESTGIFLFSIYNFNASNWSLVLIFIKLLVMIVTTIAGRINTNVYWALPCLYLICIIATIKVRPFIYKANQVLNIILYVLNFLFSLFPMATYFNFVIPTDITLYVSLALVIIPILSIISLLFCSHDVFMKNDPTYLSKKKIKKLKKAKGKLSSSGKKHSSHGKKHKKSKRESSDEIPDPEKPFLLGENFGFEDDDALQYLTHEEMREIQKELKKDALVPDIQERKFVKIDEGYMDSIWWRYNSLQNRVRKSTSEGARIDQFFEHTKSFRISKRLIYNRCVKMYKMIDIILDGSTIELLTKTLNGVMLIGACAFGWYIGALLASSQKAENIFCG
ncbi:hypothetical protein TRFO_10291 [Tritrichomonas foetus]|uniref:TRP C-terminal domain-containing protein n=1 Tax=Tritrichomonas foetus TaxID=1144522 RepID=A0A1J4J9Q1_9EUKA|nr:hypothetical protein TRFO_10291 [Tritrichomonas foetus]|eukprot:OHS95880.1 hypothetical protein TRFO_10291 [Tritrichomonas foetus]